MKGTILLLILLTALPAFCQNAPTERHLIENTIQLYFDGWATGDTTKLGKAMHASCHLKNYRDGKFTSFSKSQYLGLFKLHDRPKNLQTNIVALDITNNMGS